MASGGGNADKESKNSQNGSGKLIVNAKKVDKLTHGKDVVDITITSDSDNVPELEVKTIEKNGQQIEDKTDLKVTVGTSGNTNFAEETAISLQQDSAECDGENNGLASDGDFVPGEETHTVEDSQRTVQPGATSFVQDFSGAIRMGIVEANSRQYCMCKYNKSLNIAGNSCVCVQININDELVSDLRREGRLGVEIATNRVVIQLMWDDLTARNLYNTGKIQVDITNSLPRIKKENVLVEMINELTTDGAHHAKEIVEKCLEQLCVRILSISCGCIEIFYVSHGDCCITDHNDTIQRILEESLVTNKVNEVADCQVHLNVTVKDCHRSALPSQYLMSSSKSSLDKSQVAEIKELLSKVVSQEVQASVKECLGDVVTRQKEQENVLQAIQNKLDSIYSSKRSAVIDPVHRETESLSESMSIDELDTTGQVSHGQELSSTEENVVNRVATDAASTSPIQQIPDRVTSPVQPLLPPAGAAVADALPDLYDVIMGRDESLSSSRPQTDDMSLEDIEHSICQENSELKKALESFYENSFKVKTREKFWEMIQQVRQVKQSCRELPKCEQVMNTVLCLDISKNMEGKESFVKEVLKNFIDEVEESTMSEDSPLEENVALVSFGDKVTAECLLTNEFESIRSLIGLDVGKGLQLGDKTNPAILEALLTSLIVIRESKPSQSPRDIGREECNLRPRIAVICCDDSINSMTDQMKQALDSLAVIMKNTDADCSIDYVPVGSSDKPLAVFQDLARKTGGRCLEQGRQNQLGRYYRQQYMLRQTVDEIVRTNAQNTSKKREIFYSQAAKFSLLDDEKNSLYKQLEDRLNTTRQFIQVSTRSSSTSSPSPPTSVSTPLSRHGRSSLVSALSTTVSISTDTVVDSSPISISPEVKRPPLKKGDRVQRGPDWQYGDAQDGGQDGVGEVLNIETGKTVEVRWQKTNKIDKYRYGADNKYDVQLAPEVELLIRPVKEEEKSWIQGTVEASTPAPSDPNIFIMQQRLMMPKNGAIQQKDTLAQKPSLSSLKSQYSEEESSDLEVDGGLPVKNETVIVWQWKDRGGKWHLFTDDQIRQIESSYQRKLDMCVVTNKQNRRYHLDFKRQKRQDLDTGNYQDIRRKEMSRKIYHDEKAMENLVSYWKN